MFQKNTKLFYQLCVQSKAWKYQVIDEHQPNLTNLKQIVIHLRGTAKTSIAVIEVDQTLVAARGAIAIIYHFPKPSFIDIWRNRIGDNGDICATFLGVVTIIVPSWQAQISLHNQ